MVRGKQSKGDGVKYYTIVRASRSFTKDEGKGKRTVSILSRMWDRNEPRPQQKDGVL